MGEMDTIAPGSMKRKGCVENHDDFAEISLFQPAIKIRRLDAEFPTSMESQEVVGFMFDDDPSEGKVIDATPNVVLSRNEPFLPPTMNEERALVLYKPMYPSLKINQELITDLKNLAFWPGNNDIMKEMLSKSDQFSSTDCLKMVPWVPSRSRPPAEEFSTSRTEPLEEPMEEEMDGASMEVEEESFPSPKQHCMMSELQQATTSTPITWL